LSGQQQLEHLDQDRSAADALRHFFCNYKNMSFNRVPSKIKILLSSNPFEYCRAVILAPLEGSATLSRVIIAAKSNHRQSLALQSMMGTQLENN